MFIDLSAPVFISSYFSSSGNFIIIMGFPYPNLCASGDFPHSVFLTYLIVISFPPFTLSFICGFHPGATALRTGNHRLNTHTNPCPIKFLWDFSHDLGFASPWATVCVLAPWLKYLHTRYSVATEVTSTHFCHIAARILLDILE